MSVYHWSVKWDVFLLHTFITNKNSSKTEAEALSKGSKGLVTIH